MHLKLKSLDKPIPFSCNSLASIANFRLSKLSKYYFLKRVKYLLLRLYIYSTNVRSRLLDANKGHMKCRSGDSVVPNRKNYHKLRLIELLFFLGIKR